MTARSELLVKVPEAQRRTSCTLSAAAKAKRIFRRLFNGFLFGSAKPKRVLVYRVGKLLYLVLLIFK